MERGIALTLATFDDVELITDIKSDTALWQYENDISTDKEAVRKTVIERINSDWYKQYILRLNSEEGTPVGEAHIHWYDKSRGSWEIGYCVFNEYRGRGYCTNAARLLLGYAFKDFKAHKVVAMCNEYNEASYRVMEKIGMQREGVFREELFWHGKWVNQFFYSILESEYEQNEAITIIHTGI